MMIMESISIFDMIKIGIGPSSSHTMGPWSAMLLLRKELQEKKLFEKTDKIIITLYGSLAKTGKGHKTDLAILCGLVGLDYQNLDEKAFEELVNNAKKLHYIKTSNKTTLIFDYQNNIIFNFNQILPFHPNGLSANVYSNEKIIYTTSYYSVGGGFILKEGEKTNIDYRKPSEFPCHDAAEILNNCNEMGISIADLVLINEETWLPRPIIKENCTLLWQTMKASIFNGINKSGELPGGLKVQRRASKISKNLLNQSFKDIEDWILAIKDTPHTFTNINKWITCFALAVNEENACMGKIVTAPTNGAAGVIPAVMLYSYCFLPNITEEKMIEFLLVAGEIGTLYKKKATISAAMGGCQAEIGVSSSMAAAGLTHILGGTPAQVLQAAEIAMEHHLGLTCDPIGGLVQIPCIERNAMGAIKAITASNIAIESDPKNARVSLDNVIKSMWQTAQDMNHKYKETAEGGLASQISVNIAEC